QITDRHVDPEVVVPAARLEQRHLDGRIRRQPVREHAAGRAGAYDHVVVLAQCAGLVGTDERNSSPREKPPDTHYRNKVSGTFFEKWVSDTFFLAGHFPASRESVPGTRCPKKVSDTLSSRIGAWHRFFGCGR